MANDPSRMLGFLFALMQSELMLAAHGNSCPPTPGTEQLRRQQPFYEVVLAESGVLLFHGGELAQVIAPPAPRPAGNYFETDYLGLLPMQPKRAAFDSKLRENEDHDSSE